MTNIRSADEVTAAMLAAAPPDQRPLLVADPESVAVPATLITDPEWMAEQIRLGQHLWGTDDVLVLGTLWWYSTSRLLVAPTIISQFLTGSALSPTLDDVVLYWHRDGIIRSIESTGVLAEPISTPLFHATGAAIEQVAIICGKGERRLWSLAVDSIATCYLRLGVATGRSDEAQEAAHQLVRDMSDQLPEPRFEAVYSARDGTRQNFVRRGSCCLIYQAPNMNLCMSCPRQHPDTRHQRLRER